MTTNDKQLLKLLGEQLARIIELENSLETADEVFRKISAKGVLPRVKK